MKKYDIARIIEDSDSGDPTLSQRASNRLLSGDPELQSLLWLLREGVIGRRHFQNLVVSAVSS